jgi:hypothetical protein
MSHTACLFFASHLSPWHSPAAAPCSWLRAPHVTPTPLQHVALHLLVLWLSYAKPQQYAARWRCPLMLARRLLMPAANMAAAYVLPPSGWLAAELLGENRLWVATLEIAVHGIMYPVRPRCL